MENPSQNEINMSKVPEPPKAPSSSPKMDTRPQKDPFIQIGYLQQCLSSDKRPIGLFLGAGCPLGIRDGSGPLIPDIAGLTEQVRNNIKADADLGSSFAKMLSHFSEDGRPNPTLEHMLSHIRSLKAVAGKGEVRGLTADELDKLDQRICSIVQEAVDRSLPDRDTPYHRLASWVESIDRSSPVEVFTTNYDLLMEQAFEDAGVPFFDGFSGSRKPYFDLESVETDKLPSRWARLWKLHGSINWYQVQGRGVFRGSTTEKDERRVIHPSHLKYEESRRMPYLALIDRLRAFLKVPANALILCGYSFRDDHINEVIVQGLQSTPTAVGFALLFGSLAGYPEAVRLALRRTNLALLAEDGAVLSGVEVTWTQKPKESLTGQPTKPWIDWVPAKTEGPDGFLRGSFLLGNFAVFGQFLHDLIGSKNHSDEATDGQ